jgi:hypothetical protein
MKGARGFRHVVEGMDHIADNLALFMALAGHHQDIAVFQQGRGLADRLAPVADFLRAATS